MSIRSKLVALGVLWPFGRKRKGMETLLSSMERASVAPFKAHLESSKPTWWLRAVARKKTVAKKAVKKAAPKKASKRRRR